MSPPRGAFIGKAFFPFNKGLCEQVGTCPPISANSSGMKQEELPLKTWGGKRKGAGRPPKRAKAGVSHLRRAVFGRLLPVHVTMRTSPDVGYLRGALLFSAI